jgi:hypothetical protein
MAAIVLDSNLIPNTQLGTGYGALPYAIPDEERGEVVTNEDGTVTVPTYQLESNVPTFDLSEMQNIYGTKYMPMFRWISQKQTGTVTFDPEEDQISDEEYERLSSEFSSETGMSPEEAMREQYKQEAIAVGTQLAAGVGGQIGRSIGANVGSGNLTMDNVTGGLSDFADNFDFGKIGGDLFNAPKTGPAAKVKFSPETPNDKIAEFNAVINKTPETQTDLALQKQAAADKAAYLETLKPSDSGIFSGFKDRLDSGLFDGKGSVAGRANLYGSAGAGLATVAANLIAGKNLKESVKTGAKVGVGTYVGTLIGGPLGGMIGGVLGGRVICNELMRQGIMTRKQVVLDYKFTEDYLTPQHVAGYHVWAVWMVRQMRKGRLVNFWSHVAGHRANEIAYIYGERDKPDYLGKAYRKILEPICWSIGFFCKKTDWTVLYKEKEV